MPPRHPPGHAQADFGEAAVAIARHRPRTDGGQWLAVERTAHFFAFDLPHGDACLVRAHPAATAEAWVDGHAFAFLGRAPLLAPYDNDRCLAARLLPDGPASGRGPSAACCRAP